MNAVFGFVLILLFGFVGSRLALFRGTQTKGYLAFLTSGTEFLLVGMVLGPQMANVLSHDALDQLSPVMSLGLGWFGLMMGMQFDHKIIRRIPLNIWKGSLSLFLLIFLLVSPVLVMVIDLLLKIFPRSLDMEWSSYILMPMREFSFCLLLGLIATETTYTTLAMIKRNAEARGETTKLLQLLSDTRAPMAVIVMGIWYCLFHVSNLIVKNHQKMISPLAEPSKESFTVYIWSDLGIPEHAFMPSIMNGFMWLLVSLLIGVLLGGILHYLTSERLENREILLILTGSVIFSVGIATYLHLSPLFINFLMGVTLTNLPNFTRGRVSNMIVSTEKPFYVVFMLLAGALCPSVSWLMFSLAILYVLIRGASLVLGFYASNRLFFRKKNTMTNWLGLAMLPQGGVAIALTMDYLLIYPGPYAELAFGVVILSVLINQMIGPGLCIYILRKIGEVGKYQAKTAAASRS